MLPILSPDELQQKVEQGISLCVDFFNENCGPCKMVELVLADLSQHMTHVQFAKVDLIAHPELIASLQLESIPQTIIYKQGKEQKRFPGVPSKDALISSLEA